MLEQEQKAYAERKAELLRDGEGKYVVIGGSEVVGLFEEYEDALGAGYDRFGVDADFMVKRVVADERPKFVNPMFICPTSRSK